MSSVFR